MSIIKEVSSPELPTYDDLNERIEGLRRILINEELLQFEIPLYDNNILKFNMENLNADEKMMYYKVLALTVEAIKDFKNPSNNGFNVLSYHLPRDDNHITQEDLKEFNKFARDYSEKYKTKLLSYRQLLLKNRQIIGSKLRSKYFEKWKYEDILGLLRERLSNLDDCSKDRKREPAKRNYLQGEYERERQLLEQGSPSLGQIADTIQWTSASYNLYDTGDFKTDFEQFYRSILEKINNTQYNIKSLATFLPLRLFNVDGSGQFTINDEQFRRFLLEEGSNHAPFQQFILNFLEDANSHFSNGFYQLFINYSLDYDARNPCPNCDWNIFVNLFIMFIMSHSEKMIFPISFMLPNTLPAYNSSNNSYSFTLSRPYRPSSIFNASRVFLGVHFIKYIKFNPNGGGVGETAILPIFTFKNNEYDLDIPITTFIFSFYTGKLLKYFVTDFYLSSVEEGEIISRMNITHQELYDLYRYHGLDVYIMDNNIHQLFLTRKLESDPSLQELISRLQMRKVDLLLLQRKPNQLFRSFTVVNSGSFPASQLLRKIKADEEDPFFNISPLQPTSGLYVPPHRRTNVNGGVNGGGGKKTKKILKFKTKLISRNTYKKLSKQKTKKNKNKIKKIYKTQKNKTKL